MNKEPHQSSLLKQLPKEFMFEGTYFSMGQAILMDSYQKAIQPLYDIRLRKAKYLLKLENDPKIFDMSKEECQRHMRKIRAIYHEVHAIHTALIYGESVVLECQRTCLKHYQDFQNILEKTTPSEKIIYSLISKT